MIISFAGHRFVNNHSEIKSRVKAIMKVIAGEKSKVFCYLGKNGDFDRICLSACKDLKGEGINIEIVYVTPYITLPEQEKIKRMQKEGYVDSVIYPPIEGVPPKFSISARNRWMMSEADIVIAYVYKSYGGAYESLLIAKRKEKIIINLCE